MSLTLFVIQEDHGVMYEGSTSTYTYFEDLEKALEAFAVRTEQVHKTSIRSDEYIWLSIGSVTPEDCESDHAKLASFHKWSDKGNASRYFEGSR